MLASQSVSLALCTSRRMTEEIRPESPPHGSGSLVDGSGDSPPAMLVRMLIIHVDLFILFGRLYI